MKLCRLIRYPIDDACWESDFRKDLGAVLKDFIAGDAARKPGKRWEDLSDKEKGRISRSSPLLNTAVCIVLLVIWSLGIVLHFFISGHFDPQLLLASPEQLVLQITFQDAVSGVSFDELGRHLVPFVLLGLLCAWLLGGVSPALKSRSAAVFGRVQNFFSDILDYFSHWRRAVAARGFSSPYFFVCNAHPGCYEKPIGIAEARCDKKKTKKKFYFCNFHNPDINLWIKHNLELRGLQIDKISFFEKPPDDDGIFF